MGLRKKLRVLRPLLLAIVASILLIPRGSLAVPTDFDEDGTSDVVTLRIRTDKKLSWRAKLSSTGETLNLGTLGLQGDHLVMAQWLSSGTQVAAVALTNTTNRILWTMKDEQGQVYRKSFGQKGDLVIGGADFNGNGRADAAVARVKNGLIEWEIWYDMFAVATENKVTFTFGSNGDRVFYARPRVGSADWIGVIRKGSGKHSLARMKNLVTNEVRQYARLPKFAGEGDRPRPFPIRQSSGGDYLGFQVVESGKTFIRVYSFNGTSIGSTEFSGAGTSVVGEFNESPGYEVAFLGDEATGIFNPVDSEVVDIDSTTLTPVDEINLNTLGATSNGGSTGCSEIVSWPSSLVYRTAGASNFPSSDVRSSSIAVLLQRGATGTLPSCVNAISENGQVLAKLGLYGTGGGWAGRYYAGVGCGAATAVNGPALASLASSASGSGKVYMKFENKCYGPIDASQCVNSSQC